MKSVTQLKSLGDMRTIISTHSRSVPRHKGSNYLDVLSLGMEKQRLEAEMEWLGKREKRIRGRLIEIREAMDNLLDKLGEEPTPGSAVLAGGDASVAKHDDTDSAKWKKMTVEY